MDCRNELVQRERRGQLTNSERMALDAHLESCESCRLTRLLGHDFDDWNMVDSDDAHRLERLMARSERWTKQPRHLAKPARTRWAVLALAATMAAAAATTVAVSKHATRSPPAADGTVGSAAQGRTHVSIPAASAGADVGVLATASASANGPSETEDTSSPDPVRATPKPPSASQLLQKAQQARRGGDTKEAMGLFRRLQREYVGSREAGLSYVALGTMQLERGDAGAALDQFNRYLSSRGGAPLTAEALYGKGRALSQLGQRDQERQIWQRLLNEYPQSPYASHAKRRLAKPD